MRNTIQLIHSTGDPYSNSTSSGTGIVVLPEGQQGLFGGDEAPSE